MCRSRLIAYLIAASALFPREPAEAQQICYGYDNLGRLVGVVDQQGRTAIYGYDAVGNVLAIQRTDATGPVAITFVTLDLGAVGEQVQILGIGFSGIASENQVTFNGVPATVLSAASCSLIVEIPPGATSGPIVVTTPLGSATSEKPFTVLQVPSITSLSPNFGIQGSTIVNFRINGVNLHNSTSVQFAPSDGIMVGNPPRVNADGKSAIVSLVIHADAALVVRVVTVTNPAGTSSSTPSPQNSFSVQPKQFVVARPRVTALLPGPGRTGGLQTNVTVAKPPASVLLPGRNGLGGLRLNLTVADPPAMVLVPGPGGRGGLQTNVAVANPPVSVLLSDAGEAGELKTNLTVANPPVSVLLPGVGGAGGLRTNVTVAQPPVIIEFSSP